MNECKIPKYILYKIGSYCDIYTCSNLFMTCKKLYDEFYNKINEIHNELNYIDISPLCELITGIIMYQTNEDKYYKFKHHEYINENSLIISINNIGQNEFKNNTVFKNAGFNLLDYILFENLVTNFMNHVLKNIIILNKKNLSNIHSIIFAGKFKKIIIKNNICKHNDMEDLFINLCAKNNKKYGRLCDYTNNKCDLNKTLYIFYMKYLYMKLLIVFHYIDYYYLYKQRIY